MMRFITPSVRDAAGRVMQAENLKFVQFDVSPKWRR